MQTSRELLLYANELIDRLRPLEDDRGADFTERNFKLLELFAAEKNPKLKSYYRTKSNSKEFLWDFIAWSPNDGIFLACESEQAVHTNSEVENLKHDFEKLLYVYAPIRLLMTKAKDRGHAETLVESLRSYAKGCCLTFNPGAVFIIHFCLYHNGGNVFYIWQSEGEPHPTKEEELFFRQA